MRQVKAGTGARLDLLLSSRYRDGQASIGGYPERNRDWRPLHYRHDFFDEYAEFMAKISKKFRN